MNRTSKAGLVAALLIAIAAPASAAPKEFKTVAELAESVRSGKTKDGWRVSLKKVVITTAPVATDYDGTPSPYTTWFYVNDPGRDGDGILVTLPNYYSGTNPFDEEDDNPWESELDIPELKRGYEISLSGIISDRGAGKGFELSRTDEPSDSDFYDLVTTGSGDNVSHSVKHNVKVLTKNAKPAPTPPSGLIVIPTTDLKPGDVLTVIAKNQGDRAKLLIDGQPVELSQKRPGLLVANVPMNAKAGAHTVQVYNPESGKSAPVSFTVVTKEPEGPKLTNVIRSGNVLVLRGTSFNGAGAFEVRMGTAKLERILQRSDSTIVIELPAGIADAPVKVTVGTKSTAAVAPKPPSATTGLLGGLGNP